MQHIIFFGHKMFRGKDTAAKHLIENYGFSRVAFADSLRTYVGELYGLSCEQMTTELKSEVVPRLGITPRKILQDFGAEQRSRDNDIWVRLACKKILDHSSSSGGVDRHVAITDFRFPNEYFFTKRHFDSLGHSVKITTIKVNRHQLDHANLPGSDNISETALDDFANWDYELNNNSTIDDLNKQLDSILCNIGISNVVKF